MTNSAQSKLPSETLTLEEIVERYRDKWILLRVTELDDRHEPTAGQIVAVSDRHHVVWNKLAKMQDQRGGKQPGSYYVFQAFPRIHSGAAWKAILESAAQQVLPRGFRW